MEKILNANYVFFVQFVIFAKIKILSITFFIHSETVVPI